MEIVVTEHAEKRCRERLGLKRKAIQGVAETAFTNGKKHSDFSGSIKRYLDSEFLKRKTANNLRVWNGYVFLFHGQTLITAFILPCKYR